ncbi:MAG: PD-(D/E)XK nuclease family protein [Candidatus Marinimicrobia bacterium]|nr:PD-(D/E)XK nuclease family protein [Candidatus Neomarinimicrobiota bacterium]
MDGGGEDVFSGGSGESGLALGSCFHWCVERAWFEPEAHREALTERIADRYPEAEPGEIIDKCRMLMKDLREHELYGILRDPGVEKYHELALTGWLMRDNDVLQVNGKIDLLFRHRGRWVVVDLKTDAGGENLQRYERQIRTYQWMLRQAYGIEAEGRLYFVRRNRYVRVDEDARYFDKLPPGPGYRPKLPPAGISTEKLPPLRDGAPRMLFCPSSHYASRLFLSLVSRGLMRPSVRIVNFSSWIRDRCVHCLSKDRLRLMILSDVPEASRGFGELMASAIFDHELGKGKLLPEFGSLYARIRKKRQTAGFASAAEKYNDSVPTEIPAGTKVGFMDLQPLLPLQQRIRERIGKEFESFSATLLPARTVKRPYSCIRAFSPREEVIAVARRIRSSGSSSGNILIAVSSMDKYAGLIARIFPQFGLPVRFIESPSAARSPSVMLLQEFLHLLSVDKPEWPDLAPVLMHPLCRSADDLREVDRKYRANPEGEDFLPLRTRHLIEQYRISGADDITETVERFIRDMELTADAEDDALSAIERFREVLREVLRDMALLNCGKDPGLISAEVRTRLQKAAVRRRTHENGIPVVGYLDSAGLDPGHMFVMGMIEGDIPRREDSNPYLFSCEYYSLKLNRYFMKKWMGLGERVTFSWPAHAEDGTEQQISALLENIEKRVQAAPENGGRREQLLNYENRCIDADYPAIRRHNEIVRGAMGAFSGKVGEARTHFNLSVSAVDTLLACPMRFYYERILRVQPADQDAAAARAQKREISFTVFLRISESAEALNCLSERPCRFFVPLSARCSAMKGSTSKILWSATVSAIMS